MSLAMVFPGQGSQSVGMLHALSIAEPVVRETFDEASRVLGYDLWALVQAGPAEDLNQTRRTQPAMLAAGVATWRIWCAHDGPSPVVVAGHSLGEYSALVAAGSIEFTTAVRLVDERARLMQAAVPRGEGGIAALLGLDDETVISLCQQVSETMSPRQVSAVNFNAPGQVVVAGHHDAVNAALVAAREAGARRAIVLPMSVPVHCELMRPAAQGLDPALEKADFHAPRFPVLHNADVASHDGAEAIRTALSHQLYTPVRWSDTVRSMQAMGVQTLVECGPGKVLSGLCRRIDRGLGAQYLEDPQSLMKALESAGASA
jgi:[acyl-carrier-protein] S-malonyltransferase